MWTHQDKGYNIFLIGIIHKHKSYKHFAVAAER